MLSLVLSCDTYRAVARVSRYVSYRQTFVKIKQSSDH